MNKTVTSQSDILKASRNMVLSSGISAFSMRAIAVQCGISVGSIYNYFPSKADLLSATIESVWTDIFKTFNDTKEFCSFTDCVSSLFETIQDGNRCYPGFFNIHSLHFASEDRVKGREMMKRYFYKLEDKLIKALEADINVKEGMFQESLTKLTFVNYVFTLILSIHLRNQTDSRPLIEMIKSCIY